MTGSLANTTTIAADTEQVSAAGAEVGSLVEALQAAHAALDAASVRDEHGRVTGWGPVDTLSPEELAEVVRLGATLEGRVAGLRLHCVAAAEAAGAVAAEAATDADAWAARAGRNRSRSWGGLWLADLLETRYPATRQALATGRISEDHAAVIVRAAESIPEQVRAALSEGDLAGCEERLVDKAARMNPTNLRRAARRLLDPLSRQLADEHEEDQLRDQELRAEINTWLTLGDNGDGTWTGKFTISDFHAAILKKALDILANPRRTTPSNGSDSAADSATADATADASGGAFGDCAGNWSRTRRDPTLKNWGYAERLGMAFCELLEHLPETGHSRSGIHLVVHLEEEHLHDRVGGLLTDTGTVISTQQTRRLACDAGLLSFVHRGKSVPLDLGTRQRLFSRAQVIALSAIYQTCAADGCERPFAWCEIHHLKPFSEGGPTDLANAVPLCGNHHRRIHDHRYHHHREPDGTIVFEDKYRRPPTWPPARAA